MKISFDFSTEEQTKILKTSGFTVEKYTIEAKKHFYGETPINRSILIAYKGHKPKDSQCFEHTINKVFKNLFTKENITNLFIKI